MTKLYESLIGKQVYFRMNKKVWKKYGPGYLTPNKLYTVIEQSSTTKGIRFINDDGDSTFTSRIGNCSHLNGLTKWLVKRKPANKS
jgi:hypothetical protein